MVGGKVIGSAEKFFFAPGGRYFQMKEKRAKKAKEKKRLKAEIKNQKRDWKTLEDARVIFNKGMEKANKLSGKERTEFLDSLEKALESRVVRTWDPVAARANKEQSFAHREISSMTAKVYMEKRRSK